MQLATRFTAAITIAVLGVAAALAALAIHKAYSPTVTRPGGVVAQSPGTHVPVAVLTPRSHAM